MNEKEQKKLEESLNDPKYVTFQINVAKYKTTLTKKFINRKKWEPKNLKNITAFIPGTISKIMVSKGKSVKEGDNLLILEAMKMNNNVFSPLTGKIKAIHVTEGDRVMKDQLLVELE